MSTVFVRGFDFGTSEADVRSHCASVGKVKNVELWGKGGAQVTFTSPALAQAAVDTLNGTVIPGNSRYIDVKVDEKQSDGNAGAGKRPAGGETVPAGAGRVFVRGFDFGTTDEQLESHCSPAGKIVKVQWCTKGSAIVTYSKMAQAQKAVNTLNGTVLSGNERYIDVILKEGEDDMQPPAKRQKGAAATPVPASVPWMAKGSKNGTAKAMGKGTAKGKGKGMSKGKSKGGGRVFVRGFDFGTTDEQFEGHLSSAGQIVDIQWVTKGSAAVTFSTQAEAETAVNTLNQTVIEGNSRYIDVLLKDE